MRFQEKKSVYPEHLKNGSRTDTSKAFLRRVFNRAPLWIWMRNYAPGLLLGVICVLALFLRILNIEKFDLQFDEIYSFVKIHPQELFKVSCEYMNSRPLYIYNLFMTYWQSLGGGAFVYRLPSAIFGALACPVIYLLSKEMFGRKVGVISAFLLAFSSLHIYYSQEISPYSLSALLVVFSFYAFVIWQRTNKSGFLILNLICNLIGMYLAYYYISVVFLQFFAYFAINGNTSFAGRKRYFLIGYIFFLLMALPWIYLFAKELSRILALKNACPTSYSITPYNIKVSWESVIHSLKNFSTGYYSPGAVRMVGFLLFSGLFGYGMMDIYISRREKFCPLLCFFILPMISLVIISAAAMIYTDRYLFISMFFFYIIAACGLKRLFLCRKAPALAILAILISVQLFSLYDYYTDRNCAPLAERPGLDSRKSFKQAVLYLGSQMREKDALLHLSENSTLPFEYYYNSLNSGIRYGDAGPVMASMPRIMGFIEDYLFTYRTVPKLVFHDLKEHRLHILFLQPGTRPSHSGTEFPDRDYERLWLVYSAWDGSTPFGLLGLFESSLGVNYAITDIKYFGNVKLFLYHRR